LGSTPPRNVAEHLFQKNPRAGKKFVEQLEADKTPLKPRL